MSPAKTDALVESVARVLLATADVHDLGWNNLRTTAEALLPLFAAAWDDGYDRSSDTCPYNAPHHFAHGNPYTERDD